MRKIFISMLTACSMMVTSAYADGTTIDAGVKMTYINGSATTASYGEVTTAYCGYNKISGGAVALANSGWGVNNIAYVQVDASAVPAGATITNVTLTADLQQLAARGLAYGCGYNSSEWSKDLTWDTAVRTITTCGDMVWCSKSAKDATGKTFDITNAFKDDADKIATILVYQTAAGGGYITNVSAKVTYSMSTQADFTIKYMCGTEEIKDATKGSGDVDAKATITDGDKVAIYSADNTTKYVYSSDNASETTITSDGNAVVTVNFTEAPIYTVKATYEDGTEIASANVFDGDNVVLYVPYYRLADGTLYVSPVASVGTLSYGMLTVSGVAENTTSVISYTEDATQNAVFYSEAENISSLTAYNDGYTQIRMSNGSAAYAAADGTVITTLQPGKYTLTSSTRAGNTAFCAGADTIMVLTSTGSVATPTSEEFTLTQATDITVSAGGKSAYFDYVLIRKTGEYVAPTITEEMQYANNGSLCYDYAATVSGTTVYEFAGICDNKVYGKEVTSITAGKPYIVAAGTLTLTRDADATAATSGSDYNGFYGVLGDDVTGLGNESLIFYNGNLYYANDNTCTKGHAYFVISKIPTENAAAVLGAKAIFSLDDFSTGINAVNAAQNNAPVYNIAGQRVSKAQNGIFIVNGKKIVK